MKKLALSLLFSTALITNTFGGAKTTDLGPIQLITTNGLNTFEAGTVNLSGIINIGQTGTDAITMQSAGITPGASIGNENITTVMSVDSAHNIVTGPLIQLGSTGNNIITASTSGSLDITSKSGSPILLTATDSNIAIVSSQLTPAASTYGKVLLAIDSNGDLLTSNSAGQFVIGNYSGTSTNYILVDNTGGIGVGIILTTENGVSGVANIALNAGANNHIIFGNNAKITSPANGLSLLGIGVGGIVSTYSSTDPLVIGSLTAAGASGEFISLGIPSTGNFFGFTSDTGNITLSSSASTNSNINIAANGTGNINLASGGMNAIANSNPKLTVLALDRSSNLITSNASQVFILGSDATNHNYIELDNTTTTNGVNIAAQALYLDVPSLIPAAGYTNVLTIDETGKVGIVVSSAQYKENIKSLDINDNSFDSLEAVSYQYKGKDHTEYGFIAEEVAKNESLKNAVIYAKDGSAMSINYQAIFVALTAQFLKTKKEFNEKLKSLESELSFKDEALHSLSKKCELLEKAIVEIANRIASK